MRVHLIGVFTPPSSLLQRHVAWKTRAIEVKILHARTLRDLSLGEKNFSSRRWPVSAVQ